MAETPTVFDPVAVIADLRAAGVQTVVHNGELFFHAEKGFGDGYTAVHEKWLAARDACPDYIDRLKAVAPRKLEPSTLFREPGA